MAFIFRIVSYTKFLFRLRNVAATFKRAMSYAFHEIKHIMEPYLDDLTSHLQHREHNVYHLRVIYPMCLHYNIRLNPQKCVYCVETSRVLGFIISKDGIPIDPLKIEAILALPFLQILLNLKILKERKTLYIVSSATTSRIHMVSCVC